jgi:hypothetical protein
MKLAPILKLIEQGFKVVPIPHKEKGPKIAGWQNLAITKDDVREYFSDNQPMNVGVLLGEPSGGVVDVDIDNFDAVKLAGHFLPATSMVFGRDGKPRSHHIYFCPEYKKTKRYETKSDGCIIEMRSNGAQTVFPPSTHTSGEEIKYYIDGTPTTIDAKKLETACRAIFIGTIIVGNYPTEGSRNDFWLAACSLVLKTFQNDVRKAERFIQIVAKYAGDDEYTQRHSAVESTLRKMTNGEPYQGIPTLKKFLGEETVRSILKHINFVDFDSLEEGGSNSEDQIEELNKIYAHVTTAPTTSILKEHKSENGQISFELLNVSAFKSELAPRMVGKTPLSSYWLNSPHRRSYSGIEFNPTMKETGKYNTFRGFPIKPVEGDCSLILAHYRDVICSGNEEYFRYLMAWFAQIRRTWERKTGTAIVLRGEQGTGKSIAIWMFGRLLGQHYKIANNERYLSGNFNSFLQDCLLLNLEEAFFAGNKALESTLKDIITGDQINIEYKGREPIIIDNHIRIAITTNSDWAIPAGRNERRFFVLDVSSEKMQRQDYFEALIHQYYNGGQEAFMHYLMNLDCSDVDLRKVPKTAALLKQKLNSLNGIEGWWMEVLNRGAFQFKNEWCLAVQTNMVFHDYARTMAITNTKYRSYSTKVGQFLRDIVPDLKKTTDISGYNVEADAPDEGGVYYIFPDLETCRKAFERHLGQPIDWWTGL